MELSELFPSPGSRHRKKRIGRGISAGQGKTCGRGHKGDKARGQSKLGFEGGQTPLHRRIPRRRGFTNIFRREMAEVNVGQLEVFDAGTVITPELILEKKIVRKLCDGLKVLGDGALTKSLTVKANAFSKSAVAKIEAAGGKVEILGAPQAVQPSEVKADEQPEQAEAAEPADEDMKAENSDEKLAQEGQE